MSPDHLLGHLDRLVPRPDSARNDGGLLSLIGAAILVRSLLELQRVPLGFNPNGVPTQEGMLYCYQFFRDLNLVPEPVSDATFASLWGTDLIEEVLTEIGRVPES